MVWIGSGSAEHLLNRTVLRETILPYNIETSVNKVPRLSDNLTFLVHVGPLWHLRSSHGFLYGET